MKKRVFVSLCVTIAISALFFGLRATKINAPISTENISKQAWETFQSYLNFANEKDLAGIKSLSHQISPECSDVSKTQACNDLMESAHFFGKDELQENYIHIWHDSKQVILSTDFKIEDVGTTTIAYTRGIIYLTLDKQDGLKILSFNPSDGVLLNKDKYEESEIQARLIDLVKDSDQDGLPDLVETCAGYAVERNCPNKITDANKRDTNKNGWWDGTETFFRK